MASQKIHIGTSGFHYEHWVGPFYTEKLNPRNFLEFYSQHFHTVEMNNTFYRLPQPQMVSNWRDRVPKDFIFAAKASRYITHIKKLINVEDAVGMFFDRIQLFGPKVGPILFQFPRGFHFNIERLTAFMPLLPKGYIYAFEFRDSSWNNDQTYKLLKKFKAAFCIHDYGGQITPIIVTARFVYLRLHGPTGRYAGNYPDKTLKDWSKEILEWVSQKKQVYCYFNNDQAGYAVANAATLKEMLSAE